MTTISIKDLKVLYKSKHGLLGKENTVCAVNGVSLDIKAGEIIAIAGESGCGKSTLAKAIIGLEPLYSGEILFDGKNVFDMNRAELMNFRKSVQMVFQNPYASLNPKMKVKDILVEPLKINTNLSPKEIQEKISDVVSKVGLDESSLELYPHEFSGGQRQRIAIARALILSPQFILADEPVSALDVSIQAQIINLLKELKEDYNLTLLFISHDLSVIKYLADKVAIMYLGEIVELGTRDEIFYNPAHPYTKALLSAVPQISDNIERVELKGDLPSPSTLPTGCKFHSRCPYCTSQCREINPQEILLSDTHYVKCLLHNKI